MTMLGIVLVHPDTPLGDNGKEILPLMQQKAHELVQARGTGFKIVMLPPSPVLAHGEVVAKAVPFDIEVI